MEKAVSILHQTIIAGLMATKSPILTQVLVATSPNRDTRDKPLGRITWAAAKPALYRVGN
jgi:hypothetical protein